MWERVTRRMLLAGGVAAGGLGIAGCLGEGSDGGATAGAGGSDGGGEDDATYEIWALDRGTDTGYVYEPGGEEGTFEEVESIDFAADDGGGPHTIAFTADYEYAAVACTAGARTLFVRTEDRRVVGSVETGPGSRFAAFTPDEEYVVVDVAGAGAIKRIAADLEAEEFGIDGEIVLTDSETIREHAGDFSDSSPVCHQHTGAGHSYHALGPDYRDGGLVVVDHADFSVTEVFHGEVDGVPTNSGTMPHYEESKFYLTAGRPSDSEGSEEGVGDYYVFDTEGHEPIESGFTEGIDAHDLRFTPDGEELWVLNRETGDGIVLDPGTDEAIAEVADYGPAPDVMWSSPDGEYVFVSLRGPEQAPGDSHPATGETPGFNAIDAESREIVATVEPDPIADYGADEIENEDVATPDFHGIGVRPIGEFDTEIPNSPPF
ncbi:YncE family protein [Saliphagus sp. LR7]|uniref:YncE family protein n=1 Tax=Saliphagus sp. LR7 TaxID=2282654 RepID=UPI000DF7D508|nr:cell surface protein [Saliphagus sp. LR7]